MESVCEETQNLNDTDSETFFRYQNFPRPVPRLFSVPNFFRDRFRYHKEGKNPGNGTRPRPRQQNSSLVLGLFGTKFFLPPIPRLFGTKFFRDRFRDFFLVLKFSETDSETFFGTKFFRYRFRDFFRYQIFPIPVPIPSKKENNSREREFPGPGRHTLIFNFHCTPTAFKMAIPVSIPTHHHSRRSIKRYYRHHHGG